MRPLLVGLAVAACGVVLAHVLNFPVPWLLGPLLCTAIARINEAPAESHPWIRRAGQWCIGTSVGLYFMPDVAMLLITHAPAILGCIVFALTLGTINALVLYRFGGVDLPTAWYSGAIGSASEMANLAARQGAEIDKVASAHSLRVFMVVVSVPFAFQWLGIHGADGSDLARPQAIHYGGLLALFALTSSAAWLFLRMKWSNAWILGPMLAAALLTLSGQHWSAIPQPVLNLGQLCIGWSLGSQFRPGFFARAPHFLLVAGLLNALTLALVIVTAWSLARLTGLPEATLALGLAPGGMAEMVITAKVLQLGVPIVTMMHVSRLIAMLLLIAPAYRVVARYLPRRVK